MSRAKYGCASVSNPINALQRDSDVNNDTSYDDASVRAMYNDQLTQLENLITRQHVCQQQMRDQLIAVEKQYHSVILTCLIFLWHAHIWFFFITIKTRRFVALKGNMVCGDMVCGPSCNFKIAFIHWDVFNFTFHHLTSKAYHCCMRLKHLLSLKFVWLLIIHLL